MIARQYIRSVVDVILTLRSISCAYAEVPSRVGRSENRRLGYLWSSRLTVTLSELQY